ncbi:MAG: hypothetical protein ABEL76_15585 [Bradymonadaceae bacterium]
MPPEESHDSDIDITVQLQPAPPTRKGFGNVLYIGPKADIAYSSDRVRTYNDLEAVENDNDLSQPQIDAATAYFGQDPSPDQLLIGYVDLAGGETYKDALDAIEGDTDDFYGVVIESRADAEIVDISEAVENHSRDVLCSVQTSDQANIDSSGLSSGLSAIDGKERTFLHYHDQDSEYLDIAWLGSWLVYDPDQRSAPGFQAIDVVAEYSTLLPTGATGETGFAYENNVNLMLPFSSADQFIKPARNQNGRQASFILSRDWFANRIQTDIAFEILEASNQGEKIPVGTAGTKRTSGQVQFAKLIRKRYKQGVRTQHFEEEQLDLKYPVVTQTNVNNGNVPLEAEITIATPAQSVDVTAFFSLSPVT